MSSASTKRANLSSTTQPSPKTASGSAQCHTKKNRGCGPKRARSRTTGHPKNAHGPGSALRRKSCLACSGTSGNNRMMLHMSSAVSTFDAPLVASPKQAMRAIQVSRKKLYELINTGELESYTEGKSRRITVKSINDYIERRLAAEAVRRGRAASYGDDQSRP
jgi:excisionase family DNA binding protein